MSEGQRRKLIEVALPLEAINAASLMDKNPFLPNHPRNLHLWWSRKPLAACRAILFASLVDDPSSDPDRFPTPKAVEDERSRLFEILERLVLWNGDSSGDSVIDEAAEEIRRISGSEVPSVLDPFCGGGSIPLEAQRLGLTAYASDLNPVAVLITKALIEIPPLFQSCSPVHPDARRGVGGSGTWKGASGLSEDVRRYGEWIREEAARRIGENYPRAQLPLSLGGATAPIIAWLWARTVICPNPACGASMVLTSKFAVSTKKGKQAWVEPVVDQRARSVKFVVRTGEGSPPDGTKVGRGPVFRCLVCNQIAPEEHIRAEGRAKRMRLDLLAVVADGPRGRVYLSPGDAPRVQDSGEARWEPNELLPDNARSFSPPLFGMSRYADIFTPRQLLAMTTLTDLVREVRGRVFEDAQAASLPTDQRRLANGGTGAAAYADAVATYLALAVGQLARYSCTLTPWNTVNENVAQAFGRQSLPMMWDFAEANTIDGPLAFTTAVRWVSSALSNVPATGTASARVNDAKHLTAGAPSLISCDPPYYDNIGYAELSDFFYVWLRRCLLDIHPSIFETVLTPKSDELTASPSRFGGDKGAAERDFEAGLGEAFAKIRTVADAAYPITIYYAYKQTETGSDSGQGLSVASTGWEKMLEGLLRSGLAITGTWPLRSERATRMTARGTNALASSIVLVCRPRAATAEVTTRKEFVSALKRELPEALRSLQHGNIAPVDLAQASIGPGMAVFSRYAKVLEPDGSTMRVRAALGQINAALDEILAEQEGEFDADTRWAIAWYEQYGLGSGEFGRAETLSRAKNTSVAGLVLAGIVAAARGHVRLLRRDEYSIGWDPARDDRTPIWESMHRLTHALLSDGEAAAAALLARVGGMGEPSRDLAYRLYHVAERKRWTEEALAYNAVVVAWPELVRGAQKVRTSQRDQGSLGLESTQ